jgi:hypothetical protein
LVTIFFKAFVFFTTIFFSTSFSTVSLGAAFLGLLFGVGVSTISGIETEAEGVANASEL